MTAPRTIADAVALADAGELRTIRAREAEDAQREFEARAREAEHRKRVAELNVPPKYLDTQLTFARYGSPLQQQRTRDLETFARAYVERWREHDDVVAQDFPQIVILRGDNGTGKTHALYAIGRALVERHHTRAKVVTLADLVGELRASWGDRTAASESQVARYYRDVPWLGIDEVTAESFMGEPTAHLVQLLSYREQWLRPTILTTNDDDATLARLCGAAVVDRAVGAGDVRETGTESYRIHMKLQRRAEQTRSR